MDRHTEREQRMEISSDNLVIERTFDASPKDVFEAWIVPQRMVKWGGPEHHPMIAADGDPHPGGQWWATLQQADGDEQLEQSGKYTEVRSPEHMAFTFGWDGVPGERKETLIDIDLEEVGNGRTRMIFRQGPFDTVANRDEHREGWSSAFDRLDAYLH